MPENAAYRLLAMLRGVSPDAFGLWPSGIVAAINATDDPAVFRALAAHLGPEPEPVRATVARALGHADNPEALEALEPLLRDISPAVRLAAVTAVAKHGAVDDMVPALAALIAADPNPLARRLAVHAIYVTRDRADAIAALHVASVDADPGVREAAIRVIAGFTPWSQ
jgi:hypothetical protein